MKSCLWSQAVSNSGSTSCISEAKLASFLLLVLSELAEKGSWGLPKELEVDCFFFFFLWYCTLDLRPVVGVYLLGGTLLRLEARGCCPVSRTKWSANTRSERGREWSRGIVAGQRRFMSKKKKRKCSRLHKQPDGGIDQGNTHLL